ncbi:MAG: hypothetical protein WDN69_32665 [Aliidongia sp.]
MPVRPGASSVLRRREGLGEAVSDNVVLTSYCLRHGVIGQGFGDLVEQLVDAPVQQQEPLGVGRVQRLPIRRALAMMVERRPVWSRKSWWRGPAQ